MSSSVFPALAGLTWGTKKSPIWNTRIQTSISGRETRIQLASLPRWRWTLNYEFLRAATPFEYQQLADFFNSRAGAWDSFLYSDPTDNSVTDMNFGTGDAVTTAFQIGRRLQTGGLLEPIYNVNALTNIKKNGVVQTSPGDYSISATGLVTFTSAPANGLALTWTGTYRWRCRFEQDSVDFNNFMENLWDSGVSFISILGS